MPKYTLKQNHTGQYHLFESYYDEEEQECFNTKKSICNKMEDNFKNKFKCKDEEDVFLECAKLQKAVCGNCMQELYGDDEKDEYL